MANKRSSRRLFLGLLGVLLLLLIWGGWTANRQAAMPAVAADPLQEAWELAGAVGTFDFSAESQQTLRPRAVPEMIGQTSQSVNVSLDGEALSPYEAHLNVRMEGAGLDPTPVTLVQEGAQIYILKNGEKVPTENPLGAVAPTGNYVSYLIAAENVAPCQEETLLPGSEACYTYDIDGRRFAEFVRDEMQALFDRNRAALPPGADVRVSLSPQLVQMSGSGQVMLDGDNLPLRMVLNIDMPEVNEYFDSTSRVVIDFDFDPKAVRAALASQQDDGSLLDRFAQVDIDLSGLMTLVGTMVPIALVAACRRRPWFYGFVAVTVIVSLVAVPVVRAAAYSHVFGRSDDAVLSLTEAFMPPAGSEAAPGEDAPDLQATQPVDSFEPSNYCGKDSDTNRDTDRDGLADDAENCLGTNPYVADSDYDGLPDGVETAGFVYNDRRWYGNPLRTDSNGDGRIDVLEWKKDQGTAAEWDLDNDGTPDLWDYDDDGDGVGDGRDYSPASRSVYISGGETASFDITGRYDGYLYFDMQLQPGDLEHLRYGATPLDWLSPDSRGQVTELNSSEDDIRLIPMLEVDTNVPPNHDLAEEYRVTVFTDTQQIGMRRMSIPLHPVSDGGKVEAFSFRMAYGPQELKELSEQGIRWRNLRIVWMVQTKLDQTVNGEVVEKSSSIHTYVEDAFRVTGWQVTKSGPYRSAIIGTPDFPDDDRQLFQVLFGLSSSFLNYRDPDLDEINSRFSGTNTPIEQRWGVTTTVAVDLPIDSEPHQNAGLVALNDRINTFLSSHYTWDSPNTVIIAAESQMGSYDQDELGKLVADLRDLKINLNTISMAEQRSLTLHMRDGTRAVQGSDLAVALMKRYEKTVDDALDDLSDEYPLLTAGELVALIQTMYLTWENGRARMLSLDGVSSDVTSRPDSEIYRHIYTEPLNRYGDPQNISTLPGYLVEVGRFAQQGSGLLFAGGPGQIWQYLQANVLEADILGFTAGATEFFTKVAEAVDSAMVDATRFEEVVLDDVIKHSDNKYNMDDDADTAISATLGSLGAVDGFRDAATKGLDLAGDAAKNAGKAAKWSARVTKWAKFGSSVSDFLGPASLGVEIALIWTQFAMDWITTGEFSPQALVMAIAATIVAVTLFLLSNIPVWVMAAIVALVSLIDVILLLAGSDFSITGAVTKAIAEFLYDVDVLTEIDDFKFAGRSSGLVTEQMGYVVGNRYLISDTFSGRMKQSGKDHNGSDSVDRRALELSWICAEFSLTESADLSNTAVAKNICKPGGFVFARTYDYTKRTVTYTNTLQLLVPFTQARQLNLSYTPRIVAQTAGWEEAWGGIAYGGYKTFRTKLPEDMPKKNRWDETELVIDVLPFTLDGIWQSENTYVTNHDPDGDGMTTRAEITARLGSKAYAIMADDLSPTAVNELDYNNLEQLLTNWDSHETHADIAAWCSSNPDFAFLCNTGSPPFWLAWDSDGDGLSDKFEFDENGSLGTDMTKKDTDGDGLNDGQEYRLGTQINQPDSDLDGLLDGEEVFYQHADGTWSGSWTIKAYKPGAVGPSGRETVTLPVFPDPRAADGDGDGLTDLVEREHGSSPTAYNPQPRVELAGSPLAVSPDSVEAIFVKPGDEISLDASLQTFEPYTVAATLSLEMPWHLLAAAQFNELSGDSTPNYTLAGSNVEWSLTSDPLLPGEEVHTQITAQTAGSRSMTGTATLRLPLSPVGWQRLDAGVGHSTYLGDVSALAVDPSNPNVVYAGGTFDTAGGRSANNIARWNGSSWAALGTGVDGQVEAIVIDPDGNVYAGGDFDQAGGVTVNNLTQWDGAGWHALGEGLDDAVYGLALASNGDLYAVGSFSKAGDTTVNGVARWDGSSWTALGTGLDDMASSWATSVAIDGSGNVYVGGHFYSVSGVSTSHIARWNGSSWSAMPGIHGGGGLYGSVKAVVIDPATDEVYAGGDFYQVNGQPPESGVVRWNGSGWEILPDVADDPDASHQECYALGFDGQGNLYAGGWWAESGSTDRHLARWDADSAAWTSIGTPVDESAANVYAFAGKEEGVFVGGIFDRVDTVAANNVAFYASIDSQVQQGSVLVVVDAEDPTIGMIDPHTGQIIGGGVTDYVIGGYSGDLTTWVTDVTLNLPVAGTQTLTRTTDRNLSPWAYTWALPADGVYTLSADATDFVENVSANTSAEVMVDNTPASVTVNLSEGAVYGPPQDSDTITITLEGEATDTFSGLTRVQISTDNGPWREVWTAESATITHTTYTTHSTVFRNHATRADWSAQWTLPNVESVQGYHSVRIRAFDLAGNWPETLERTIIVDVIPPTDELVNRAYLYYYPHLPAGSGHPLRGIANDVGNVPEPARPTELVGALDSVNDATIWLGLDSITDNDAGVNVAWIGDFNGDRRGDLLVGTPASAGGAGRVSILYGRSGDWNVPDAQEMLADSLNSFVGLPGAGIGMHAIPAGDVNGDGIADLLIGDPANDRVFLIFGRPSFVGRDVLLDDYQPGERSVLTVPDGQQIGEHLGAAGDVNGDGLDDLLIGATGATDTTYLLLGSTNPWREIVPLEVFGAATISGGGEATLAGIGDLDGDFRDEFALGVGNNLYLFDGRGSYAPRGMLSMSLSDAVDTRSSADATPTVARLGDVDGDQRDDFIYTDGINQRLLLGDADLDDGSWTTYDYAYGSGFVAAPGDVDNDGLNDVFIGSGSDAYLILASDLNTAHATISGVAAAASALHAAGADLNSDGSSDLLLLPDATDGQAAEGTALAELPSLPPDWMPRLSEQSLSTFVGSTTWTPVSGADAYVNGNGSCYGLTPCYTTVQAAIDARLSGDLIVVQPGVYAPFVVDGKNNMTVRGTDPDAVFVDAGGSGFAAQVANANGVRLEQMTLRNASYGVQLTEAGVGGHDPAQLALRTILDHLLIYDVGTYDVYIDRSSTVSVTRSTLVRTSNHVGLDMSSAPDVTVPTSWQTEPNTPDALYDGGGLAVYSDTLFYCTGNGARNCEVRDFPGGWFTSWAPENDIEANSALAAGSDGQFYVLGAPSWRDVSYSGVSIFAEFAEGGNGVIYTEYASGSSGPRRWNGTGWSEIPGLSSSSDCYTYAAHPVNGDLYCLNYGADVLSRWDGSGWTEMWNDPGNALGTSINDMAVGPDGNVHVVGDFSLTFMGNQCYNYAQFSGVSWSCWGDFGSGDTVSVVAVDPDSNTVYAGGDFSTDFADNITTMSGGSINSVIGGPVYAIEVGEDGVVYVGGQFTATLNFGGGIDQTTDAGIVAWDGGSWTIYPEVLPAGLLGHDYLPLDLAETNGGELYAVGQWQQYIDGSNDVEIDFIRWDGASADWEILGTSGNPTNNSVIRNIGATGQGVFINGDFDWIDRPAGSFTAQNMAALQFSHEVYTATGNAWTSDLIGAPMSLGDGASYAGDADGHLILLVGGGRTDSFMYDIQAGTWSRVGDIPDGVNASAMTLGENDDVYALTDGSASFYCFNGSWWSAVSGGGTPVAIADGAALTYDPKNNVYYAFPGGNSSDMLRYQDGSWELLPDDRDTPQTIKPGAGLVFIPGTGDDENALYAAEGSYSGSPNYGFWRYPLPEPNKVGFEHSAIVVPAGSGSADWLNLIDPLPEDFNFRVGPGNLWFNGTGEPNNQAYSLPTTTANPFLDQSRDLYRMGQSGYDLGYHTYTPPVTATTASGIQAAINSGANRVLVRPGIYEEHLYLVSGVEVVGENPDWTVIRPIVGADPLVRAEGPVGASLARVTLDGETGSVNGFEVEGNAAHIALSRSLIYDTDTAVQVDGAGSDLEVANLTVALNNNGFVALNDAPVDVRNSIFAYNDGVGLSHTAGAAPQLHTYNLFWENGGGHFGAAADAGAAELFLDPNLVDPLDYDFRTLNFSPVIDAGNPTDPAPPSAGNRADVGYVEQGRANYYVDDGYCETCTNDGLTWQVDAFDTIQEALDAAQTTLSDLNASQSDVPQLVVGVAAGTYNEQVTVPSHVLLMGSGAEVTLLNGGGATAVTFDGVTDSGLRDFTVTSAGASGVHVTGASNNVALQRNIIRDSLVGVALDGRGTGDLDFNTLVNNSTAVEVSGPGSWVNAQNNILSGTGSGFNAADSGQIFNDYNLVDCGLNYSGAAAAGEFDLVGQDPRFDGGAAPYRITAASPALDAASPGADVPDGGGTRADLGYSELLAAPISLMLGKEDLSTVMGNSGVASVEYAVVPITDSAKPVTTTLPGAWLTVTLDTPGDTYSYWQTVYTPTVEGLHRFYSRATDVVGNQEDSELDWYDGSFVADSTDPVVEWLAPADGASLNAPLELRAQVSDYAAGEFSVEEKDLHFVVGGVTYPATWAAEPWDESAGEPRVFRAWITPTVGPHNDVEARAEDKAGNTGSDASLSFTVGGTAPADTTDPALTILNPPDGGWVTSTVTFSGTATDGGSGVASVEVSVDGGVSWRPATVSGTVWSLVWEGPTGQSFVSYPASVRAADRAGNRTISPLLFTVDDIPPGGLAPVTFNFAQETHFDVAPTLVISWNAPVDGSGVVTSLLAVDQISDTIPHTPVAGTVATRTLDANGAWYVHLGALDAAGNALVQHYGPWHVGINEGVDFGEREQSIEVDGYLDLAHGEWRADGEFLDDDERPVDSEVTYSPNGRQSFYTTWDGDRLYLAWRGAWWQLDGTLWIYLNSGDGGGSELIAPLASAPSATLPFEADYAVEITAPDEGRLWAYAGGWITSTEEWAFAQGAGGDTEVRLPLFGTTDVESLAYAQGDDGAVWAIFPATNPLNPAGDAPVAGLRAPGAARPQGFSPLSQGGSEGWQSYHWDDVTIAASPAADQPRAASLGLGLDSVQSTQGTWGPGSSLQYVVQVTNREAYTLTGEQIALIAIPSASLVADEVEGVSCETANPWLCTVEELPPGTHTFTVTAHLAAELDLYSEVTLYAILQNTNVPPELPAQGQITHRMDSQPPETNVTDWPLVGLGSQTFHGTAKDGAGVGVDYVEVRPAGGSWQRAEGTRSWSADLTVPPFLTHGDAWELDVRATDLFGQEAPAQTVTFTVDLVGPSLTLAAPPALSGSFNTITGTVSDTPSGSQAYSVAVKLDDEPWREALVFAPDAEGVQPYLWTWSMPTEDGVTHTLRVRAADLVGNVGSLAAPQQVWVDNVAPALTVTEALTEVVVQDYRPGQVTGSPVLSGTVSDGGGVASLVVRVEQPDGTRYVEAAVREGQTWRYTPELTLVGDYRLRVEARDEMGNLTQSEGFDLVVVAAPDTGSNRFTTAEETPLAFEPLLDDLDLDGDALFLAAVGDPPHGSAVVSGTTWVVYTPTLNFYGRDVFTYTASDGVHTASDLITVTVTPVDDPPVILQGEAVSVTMSEDGAPLAFDLTLDAEEVDGDVLTWDIEQDAAHGTASISSTLGVSRTSATIGYTPDADYHGADSWRVRVADGTFSDSIEVNVTIAPVDDAPRAADDVLVMVLGEGDPTITLDVLSNDDEVDGQPLSISAVGAPLSGSVTISNGQRLRYTPAVTGTESFTYTITDGGLFDTASVHATVVEGEGSGGGGETLVLPGLGISDTITVTLEIPDDVGDGGDAFALVFGEAPAPDDAPAGHLFAGLAFTLEAYVNGVKTHPYTFTTPLTLTVQYDEGDVAHIGMGDAELALFFRDADQWSSDGVTVVERDTWSNRLTLTIERLSRFALFGWDAFTVYLPAVVNGVP